MTELKDRIKFIRESQNISKAEFAHRLDVSSAYIAKLESGLRTRISHQLSTVIEYRFGVSSEWLIEGKGGVFLAGDNIQTTAPETTGKLTVERHDDFLEFERLLSEVSATYINLPIGQLEKILRDDFRRLTKNLDVDACILYIGDERHDLFNNVVPFVWFIDENSEYEKIFVKWFEENVGLDSKDVPYSFEKWKKGEHVGWSQFDDGPDYALWERKSFSEFKLKSALSVPIMFNGKPKGVVSLCTTRKHRTWPDELITRMRLLGEVFINALMRKRSEEKLHKALCEIKELKEQFEADYRYLREEIKGGHDFEGIVGKSEALKKILVQVKRVAPTNTTVLILGETGTGKGLIARAIHDSSSRRDRPLMQVNCAALAPSIIESELFGHEKGSFTGAATRRLGRFEAARGTTLFLDEIGDLPLELQPKLLRALEEGEFERVGGNSTIHTDIRLIAATSRDLEKEVAAGRFRSDLWYRLNIFPIFVPPLRERLDDIPLFVEFFVEKYGRGARKRFKSISSETTKLLQSYSWPGNIRELSNVIERAVIESSGGSLSVAIPSSNEDNPVAPKRMTLREAERSSIIQALEKTNWKIKGPDGAAQYLDINPETLRSRIKKLDIKRTT